MIFDVVNIAGNPEVGSSSNIANSVFLNNCEKNNANE
jgi:hypothetical protein